MIGDRLDNDIRPARLQGWKTMRVLQGFAKFQSPRDEFDEADATVAQLMELRRPSRPRSPNSPSLTRAVAGPRHDEGAAIVAERCSRISLPHGKIGEKNRFRNARRCAAEPMRPTRSEA
jgi:hypothetical protein